ncbi:serine/threonine-protein kinase [Sphingomonas sp. NFR15]|uniref:serine/threonine-protein kinase n=1 Tax=Sphingomonas sp. NFR15 TaxID=1566282 RepID=UPI0008834751|nr:serine/threonine-protein kinase [Sphingomonas sp. NFR15]SDA24810.1 serine/threonine protein kinase [Sphingomonas sp. NFR15]
MSDPNETPPPDRADGTPADAADPMTIITADDVSPPPATGSVRRSDGGIEPGDLLNGIYRVDRFLARGGMGDVYEGVNVETDDRVAIKAIRRHLASDPKIAALFRKEARVLTQLSHPAIVHYRVLAREPQLDLLYIVTDFVDGEALSEHLDGTRPSLSRVLRLARRLAGGLDAAHQLGVVHRDVSPDNILLPGGSLGKARIIDFGIAKSLEVGAETVIGTGFAGKLGYVAPEQFGEHGREIGPWTDVYSTALVLRAFASGRPSDMGTTLAEAVERRRAVPALDEVPPELAPVLARMLVPDPAGRLPSMAAVLEALNGMDAVGAPVATASAASFTPAPTTFIAAPQGPVDSKPTVTNPATGTPKRKRRPAGARVIGGVGAALALAGGVAVLRPMHGTPATPAPVATRHAAAKPAALPPMQAVLAALPCSWVSAPNFRAGDVAVLTGASADPAALASQAQAAFVANGLKPARTDSSAVLPMPPAGCEMTAVARPRAAGLHDLPETLVAAKPVLALAPQTPGCPADPRARPEISWSQGGRREFALLALLPSGAIVQIAGSRGEFEQQARLHPDFFQDHGDDGYRVGICLSRPGPVGFLLVQSDTPLDLGMTSGRPIEPAGYFYKAFQWQAARHGWVTQAAWIRVDPAVAAPRTASLPDARPNPRATPAAQKSPAVPSRNATNETEMSKIALCRRFADQRWQDLGQTSFGACVARVYANDCDVTYGYYGTLPIRRYRGQIEGEVGGRWSALLHAPGCHRGAGGLFGLLGGRAQHRHD